MNQTVPSVYAALVFNGDKETLGHIGAKCAVKVGNKTEVDLSSVKKHVSKEAADKLKAYAKKTATFFSNYSQGVEEEYRIYSVETHVALFEKIDSRKEKIYLKDQIQNLISMNGVGEVYKIYFSGRENPELASNFGVKVEKNSNILTLTFTAEGKQEWPTHLGGASTIGEVSRTFIARISHAKSHDRKNQRLLSLEIKSSDIWPKP